MQLRSETASPVARRQARSVSAPKPATRARSRSRSRSVKAEVSRPSSDMKKSEETPHSPIKELMNDALEAFKGLLPSHKVPEYLREPYVTHGYRKPGTSAREIVRSIFTLHNETVNVWTHLLGFLLFLFLLIYSALYLSPFAGFSRLSSPISASGIANTTSHLWLEAHHHPFFAPALAKMDVMLEGLSHLRESFNELEEDIEHHLHDWHMKAEQVFEDLANRVPRIRSAREAAATVVQTSVDGLHEALHSAETALTHVREFMVPQSVARWPVFVYCVCAMTCLLMSTMFHLLGVHSHDTFFFLARCDYSGIALLIAGSCFPAFYYGFYCSNFLKAMYLVLICGFGAAVVTMCNLEWFYQPRFRLLRALLFVAMGVSGVVPALHMLYTVGHPFMAPFLLHMAAMGACYLAGVALYATRIPERYAPGKFDFFGHSHQWFHVLVVVAALVHFVGCVELHHALTSLSCDALH